MLKRILVLLGETPSSISARQYAFRLAQSMNAEVAGLAGVDLASIEAPMPGSPGGAAYKLRLEESLKKTANAVRHRLRDVYERECRAHDTRFEWLSFDGDPIEALYSAAETHDLIIAGHDTAYSGTGPEPRSEILAKLLLATPRPMIICPDEISGLPEILIAYDGSVPAMRAVQMFVLLGLGQGKRILVTAVDASQELAARKTSAAAGYLRSHGHDVEANPIVSRVHPAEVLGAEIADRKIGTLVMGAYGHRRFREFLFGSTTNTLLESPPCAIFVYH